VVGLALQYVFAHRLALLPLDGLGTTPSERVRGFVLPVVTLGIYGSALFSRVVREELRGMLRADFTRTARAKGASVARALVVHALRAAVAPIATLAVLDLGALIGGAVVVERLFRLRGIGSLAVTAIQNRDAPLVTGTVLVASAATLAATLAADLVGVWLDPTKRR
jgi:peptide/nickel transport system permease protein